MFPGSGNISATPPMGGLIQVVYILCSFNPDITFSAAFASLSSCYLKKKFFWSIKTQKGLLSCFRKWFTKHFHSIHMSQMSVIISVFKVWYRGRSGVRLLCVGFEQNWRWSGIPPPYCGGLDFSCKFSCCFNIRLGFLHFNVKKALGVFASTELTLWQSALSN